VTLCFRMRKVPSQRIAPAPRVGATSHRGCRNASLMGRWRVSDRTSGDLVGVLVAVSSDDQDDIVVNVKLLYAAMR
jgi:hypothetical protein